MLLTEFINLLKTTPKDDLITKLKTIEGLYVRSGEGLDYVLLTAHITRANFDSELNRYANGLLFDTQTKEILVLPSPRFNKRVKLTDVSKHLSDYKAYKIQDGSVVNLYYDEPNQRWAMSSANGWDVSNYFWLGNKTYEEAFNECVRQYPEFSFDKLNKKFSYSVGFRHHEFHPLLNDPQSAWFIQSCDLEKLNNGTLSINYNDNIGIPLQTQITVTDQMIDDLKSALARYLANPSPQSINYGYILRSDNGRFSNVILESTLLEKIRMLMYNIPKKIEGLDTPVKRIEYNILKAHGSEDRYNFQYLFPQYKQRYEYYDTTITRIATRVVATLKSGKVFTPTTRQDQLINAVVQFFKRNDSVDLTKEDGLSIAVDFIKRPAQLDLFFKYLI